MPGALRKWVSDFKKVANLAKNDPRQVAMIEAGVTVASERRAWMKQLIRDNPEQALAEGLRFDEYASLPVEIQRLVEKPFSDRSEYTYLPVCTGPSGERPGNGLDHIAYISLSDGTDAEAFTFGQRAAVMSKRAMPASGIVLDGATALNDKVFRPVHAAEESYVRSRFQPGQTDLSRSFASGKILTAAPVLALAGDQLYAFSDTVELEEVNSRMAALDLKPGPKAGSSVLYYGGMPADPNSGGFNIEGAEEYAANEASAWTETKKKLFLIRVDFSDFTGAAVTQTAASTELNGPSSDFVKAMSYNKTWIEATVSANVYRLPQVRIYYSDTNNPSYNSGSFSSLNNELLRDSRNVFRNTKSGGDASINIGPVDNTGTGGAGGLGDYDIVAVFFTSIGMKSGGLLYAGLAGGGDMWVQNANYTSLYTHEIGHNYGLGHASFWQTSDGSVIGTGATVEYGDTYDVMGSGPAVRGHYHPQAKSLLNWITTNQWANVTNSGTHRVYRIDDQNTVGTLRGVRVTRSAVPGSQEYYWIGYRPIFSENAHLLSGAYLIWQRPNQSRSWLLDTTPGSTDGKNDAAIDLGKTYADAAINAYITPIATGGTGSERYLDVRVNIGPFPTNHAPTSPGITGPGSTSARTATAFSVSSSDSDGDTLAYYWNTGDGTVNSNSPTCNHSWPVGGVYSVQVTISDMKGGTVSLTNSITVTDPLDTWTAGTVGTTGNLQDVLYAKGRFVSADWFGNAFLSWNGTNWESLGGLPNYDNSLSSRPQFAFGANTFVVAGRRVTTSTAQLCYSLDGRLWTEATFPGGAPQLYDVAYGNGQFVAVGGSGTVFRSTNGVTWTLTTVPAATDFRFVAWDGNTWIAVALNNVGGFAERVWTSLDGVNWSQQGLLGSQTMELYSYGGTAYAQQYYGGILYSTDHGLTWQSAFTPGSTRWSVYHMATAADGTYIAAGQAMDESGTPYALLASTDGRAWARSGGNTNVAAGSHGLAFGHGRFLSVESGGVTRRSATFYPVNSAPVPSFTTAPTNGTARLPIYFAASASDANGDTPTFAWDFGSATPVSDGFEIAPVFSLGGTYAYVLRVSDGRGGISTLSNSIVVNDPARTWTKRVNASANTLYAVAGSSSNVVTVGDNGKILSSPDGTNWTARTVPDFANNIYFYSLIWDGARYLAAGEDYDFGIGDWVGIIYASTNGNNWTRVYKSTSGATTLAGLATSGSTRVAVGDFGTVLVSLNGTNWTPVTIPGLGTPTMSGAGYGNGTFVFVGYVGGNGTVKCYTSTDGTNWIDRAAGTGVASWQDLRKVAWLGNRFVSSGWYSKLRVSTDNGVTFTSNRSHTEELPATAYGDGVWFTAGVDRDASNANIDVMSLDGANWISFGGHVDTNRNGATFFNHTFISVGAGGNIWQSGVLSAAGGFPAWLLANFPSGGISSLPNRDADGDTINNAIEYSLGRNPNVGTGADGASQMPYAYILTNRLWLRLDLPEPAPFDVNYTVTGSTNSSGPWGNVASKSGTNAWQWLGGGTPRLVTGPVASGRVPVDISVPDSANTSRKYFFRIQVQTP